MSAEWLCGLCLQWLMAQQQAQRAEYLTDDHNDSCGVHVKILRERFVQDSRCWKCIWL
ncbi:hypothetical protein LBMAG46_41310 [Planctomycetia bacterium]|nr:hypothetical protein LBMAG46_41310 [Planctomycetia bacterium]